MPSIKGFLTPVVGGALSAGVMWLWIAFVNRPKVELFTIVYEGKELYAQGQPDGVVVD